jgi:hypothetical protein
MRTIELTFLEAVRAADRDHSVKIKRTSWGRTDYVRSNEHNSLIDEHGEKYAASIPDIGAENWTIIEDGSLQTADDRNTRRA